jgi:membrane associated rhomboid family serine protease
MSAVIRASEEEPLFHLGEIPVRLITLLVALHSAAMIAVSLVLASGHPGWIDLLIYNSSAVAHGQIWRLVTYAFVAVPSVWFLFEMLMLWYFGREVENGLGWKRFAILYAGLIVLGPLLLQAFGYAGIPQNFAGAQEVNFAIFAAFAAMHPGAQFFFGVAARWVFLGLLAISSLQRLADHKPAEVVVLLCSSLLAILLMRRAGYEEPLLGHRFSWSIPGMKGKRHGFSVVKGGLSASSGGATASKEQSGGKNPNTASAHDPEQEMDRLLEKISRTGIESLDAAERAALERARRAILQRGGESNR